MPIVNTYFEITASFTFLASFFLVNEEKWDRVEIARLFLNRPSEIRSAVLRNFTGQAVFIWMYYKSYGF